jgi:DNA-binding transcriptional ArsR family regulator
MPRSKSDIGLEAAATLFRNFGNPNRLAILAALSAVFDPVVPKRREPAAPKARILPFVSAAVFARVEPVDS